MITCLPKFYLRFKYSFFWYQQKKWVLWTMAAAQAAENNRDEGVICNKVVTNHGMSFISLPIHTFSVIIISISSKSNHLMLWYNLFASTGSSDNVSHTGCFLSHTRWFWAGWQPCDHDVFKLWLSWNSFVN